LRESAIKTWLGQTADMVTHRATSQRHARSDANDVIRVGEICEWIGWKLPA
jgi:hypothetical protein